MYYAVLVALGAIDYTLAVIEDDSVDQTADAESLRRGARWDCQHNATTHDAGSVNGTSVHSWRNCIPCHIGNSCSCSRHCALGESYQ